MLSKREKQVMEFIQARSVSAGYVAIFPSQIESLGFNRVEPNEPRDPREEVLARLKKKLPPEEYAFYANLPRRRRRPPKEKFEYPQFRRILTRLKKKGYIEIPRRAFEGIYQVRLLVKIESAKSAA